MLYSGMRTKYTGTDPDNILPGIIAFSRARHNCVAGSGYQKDGLVNGVTWDFIKSNIDKSYPLLVSLKQDPNYGNDNHSIVCVGYQECSDGNYLRVADGAKATISNFYYFKGNIYYARYVRW